MSTAQEAWGFALLAIHVVNAPGCPIGPRTVGEHRGSELRISPRRACTAIVMRGDGLRVAGGNFRAAGFGIGAWA
jgi:hypothetical protein